MGWKMQVGGVVQHLTTPGATVHPPHSLPPVGLEGLEAPVMAPVMAPAASSTLLEAGDKVVRLEVYGGAGGSHGGDLLVAK